jgi:saccharopine dehydrogenase-like NADP-dependent oxidoreductase
MKILLLGVGMQGKAALHDLVRSEQVSEVTAADRDLDSLLSWVESRRYGDRMRCTEVDAASPDSLDRLMAQRPDVAVDLLPARYVGNVASAAMRHGVHLVNTLYTRPAIREIADEAAERGVTILPEFGMDPGIDLVLTGHAIRWLDEVHEFYSYGAGFPESSAATNPLKYKVTWTFEGVLNSYRRAGRIIKDSQVVEIADNEMFCPENIHTVDLAGLGTLEAIPNGDSLKYANLLGLDRSKLRNLGRYSLRWPGHSALWKKLVDLHLLDEEPVVVDGTRVDRRRFLSSVLEPHMQYEAHERDVVVVRIDVRGVKSGEEKRLVYQIIDRRDLSTGLTAMSRTVGFTASIGAQMIGSGQISKRGVLSPAVDVPYEPFVRELRMRDIRVMVTEAG